MFNLSFVLAILLSTAFAQTPYYPTDYKLCADFYVATDVDKVQSDVEISIITAFAGPNGAQAQAQQCAELAVLFNQNLTALGLDITNFLSTRMALFLQNDAWTRIATVATNLFVDASFSATTDDLALGALIRIHQINRHVLLTRIYNTLGDEITITLKTDNNVAAGAFRQFVGTVAAAVALLQNSNVSCTELAPVMQALALAPTAQINGILLATSARQQVLSPILAAIAEFPALYTHNLSLAADTIAVINADFVAATRVHLLQKLNRTIHTWVELAIIFGADNITDPTRRMCDRSFRDSFDGAFDKTTECNDLISLVFLKDVVDGAIQLNVSVNISVATSAAAVQAKVIAFVRGWISAYCHPYNVTWVATSGTGGLYSLSVLIWAAPHLTTPDIRDIMGETAVVELALNPWTDFPDNYADPDFQAAIAANTALANSTAGNLSATVTGTFSPALAAYQLALIGLNADFHAITFDPTSISTLVANYSNEKLDLVVLKVRAAAAGLVVKLGHDLFIARCRQDHGEQNVTGKHFDILEANLRIKLFTAIILHATVNRTGCNVTIPDWTAQNFSDSDYYPLAQIAECAPIAGVLSQLFLLKDQVRTCIIAQKVLQVKMAAQTQAIASVTAMYTAFAADISTTFAVAKTQTEHLDTIASADFSERIIVCVRTLSNNTLGNLSLAITTGASASIKIHSLSASFDASVNVGVTLAWVQNQLNANLQLCLCVHLGGDLSYIKQNATAYTPQKREISAAQPVGSQQTTDFSSLPTTTTGAAGTSTTGGAGTSTTAGAGTSTTAGAGTSTTAGAGTSTTGGAGSSTTGAGALTFSILSLIALLAMLL